MVEEGGGSVGEKVGEGTEGEAEREREWVGREGALCTAQYAPEFY